MEDLVDSATLSSTPQQMLQQPWDFKVSSLTEECPDLICPQTTEAEAVVVDAAAIAVVEVVDSVEAEEVDLVVAEEVVSAAVEEDLVVVEEEIVAVAVAAEVVEDLPVA